jgi:hypothetical protein
LARPLVYTFARVSAALHMNVENYYPQGKRWWVRLHEKGGKQHEMPAHHLLEHFPDAYLTAFAPGRRRRVRQGVALVLHARWPRAQAAHVSANGAAGRAADDRPARTRGRDRDETRLSHVPRDRDHRLSATAACFEYAQQMAAHESACTTKLYDRRNDQVTLDQV